MRIYSHSAIKTFQRCARKWAFLYKDRIIPEFKPAAMERGIELHELLAEYYDGSKTGAGFLPDTENEEYRDLLWRYDNHWSDDDQKWKVYAVEEELETMVYGHKVVFKPDLVVNINDELWIVDHKTTANIPEEYDPYNMTDFQHLLYVAGMQELGYNIAGFIFNYIRTKPPAEVKLIKDGSRIADVRRVDTDYNTLQKFAMENGVMDEDTKDRLNLIRHSPNKFFQRHFLPVNQTAVDNAMEDIFHILTDMRTAEVHSNYPRHVVAGFGGSMSCARCPTSPSVTQN